MNLTRSSKSGKAGRHDLAMLKLEYPIKQTAYVHAVCYDEDPDSSLIWPTQYGVVTGWGSKKKVGFDVSAYLSTSEPALFIWGRLYERWIAVSAG